MPERNEHQNQSDYVGYKVYDLADPYFCEMQNKYDEEDDFDYIKINQSSEEMQWQLECGTLYLQCNL